MSVGKYSPACSEYKYYETREFIYNAKGQIPPPCENSEYNQELHYDGYDKDGYDSYGYSAYDKNGKYVGIGDGVDRFGNTEMDYLTSYTVTDDGVDYWLYNMY